MYNILTKNSLVCHACLFIHSNALCVFFKNILSIVDEIWHRGITEDSDNQLITEWQPFVDSSINEWCRGIECGEENDSTGHVEHCNLAGITALIKHYSYIGLILFVGLWHQYIKHVGSVLSIVCVLLRRAVTTIHRESKKGDTILLSISLLNIDRFT